MRNWFIKDFGWKVFSLALAILIWTTVKLAIRKEEAPPNSPAAAINIDTNQP